MFQILVSDDTDRLGHVVLHVSETGAQVTYPAENVGAPGEPIPFVLSSHALANHVAVRSPSRLHFAILGRSSLAITLRREDAGGLSIWLWRIEGAEHAAPDLAAAISEVLIWFARNADRPQTGDVPHVPSVRTPST